LTDVRLVSPSAEFLPAYVAALQSGWSPSTTRDISGEHLAAIAADPDAFLAQFQPGAGGMVRQADGSELPRVPGATYWIWDGEFCGSINYRYLRGTEELPAHVSGHVGYAVVPAKRGRGVARTALRLLLPILHELGLARVLLTCDEDNHASRQVIESTGGVYDGIAPAEGANRVRKLRFWVPTRPPANFSDMQPAAPAGPR
jgi:predicted acetyltransferase